ncbi:MAG: TetR/AcrR family transcriptional regulator [Prevotella sp.]|jgi:AcrR family transcriptional regulator|nr:TetR/AcrR family transcriptional regulator [Prevotella sp.]
MNSNKLSTEQTILEAAEAEFLEKGYGNAKTVSIAKRAGVTHSMLHYYYRTKEKLFQMIFERKVQTLAGIFEGISGQNLPFSDMLRCFVECQFDFVAQNPKLPRFVLNEIASKRENLELVVDIVSPKIAVIVSRLEKMLDEEIQKGTVRPIAIRDLIMNVVSINVATFVFMPVYKRLFPNIDETAEKAYLAERRESNVQFILNALRPA